VATGQDDGSSGISSPIWEHEVDKRAPLLRQPQRQQPAKAKRSRGGDDGDGKQRHGCRRAGQTGQAIQQSAWVGLGLLCFLVFAFADYHRWVTQGWFWFGGGLLLLLIVLIFGREVNGAKSWVRIGPVGFQPAEVMKLAFLAGACALLVSLREKMEKFRTVLALVGLALIPVFLILRQPDLGSAAVFLPMCFGLLFAGGTRLRYLLIPAGAGLAAVLAIYLYVAAF
jgi:rod shape determining protein RodA